MGDLSILLAAAGQGDREAADRVFALVYAELRRIACRQVARSIDGPGATSLVHEVYLRLARPEALHVASREHFFSLAARAMRQLVIDHALARATQKRGGNVVKDSLDEATDLPGHLGDAERLLELDQALARLAAVDPSLVALVEMRYFAGLDLSEIAQVTGRSERSLKRDWRKARLVLHAALEGGDLPDE